MTLVVAWKDKKNIFVVADTAVTRTGMSEQYVKDKLDQNDVVTIFGEKMTINSEVIISEEAVKIHNIKDRLIIAYAGVGANAIEFIDFLEEELETDFSVSAICRLVREASNMFLVKFEMVFGLMSTKVPILFTFNADQKKEFRFYNDYSPVILGNIKRTELVKKISDSLLEMLVSVRGNVPPDKKLLMACSLFQGINVRAEFINIGVGGIVTGGQVNRKGLKWLKDILYIKFNVNVPQMQKTNDPQIIYPKATFISIANREDIFAAYKFDVNKPNNGIKLFYNFYYKASLKGKQFEKKLEQWKLKYEPEIHEKIIKFDFDFMVYLCVDNDALNKITFIEKKALLTNKYFSMEWVNGVPTINLSKEFSQEINPMNAEYLNQFHWMP